MEAPRGARRVGSALLLLLPVVLGLLAFGGSLDRPFVYDDDRTVVGNPSIRDLGAVRAILHFDRFRPLVNISYAADYAVWALDPFGYHLTGLLLHLGVVVLLGLTVRRIVADAEALGETAGDRLRSTRGAAIAAGAASLFAVHPLLVEAVGYVSGRSEVLCGLWSLMALLALRRSFGRGWRWLVLGLVSLGLGLASKEVAAVVPLVLLLWDLLLVAPRDPVRAVRRRWRFHLPLVGLALVAGAIRLGSLLAVEIPNLPRPVGINLLTQLGILWRYVGLLAWPTGQSIVHPAQRVSGALDASVVGAGLAWMLVLAVAWWQRRRRPLVALSIGWFLLFLAPSSSLVPLVELMAEHRVYLASAGFFLLVVDLGHRLLGAAGRIGRVARVPLLCVALLALLFATRARLDVWSDPVSLWREATERAPLTWAPHYALGDALRIAGDCEGAIEAYGRAIELQPGDVGSRVNQATCLAEVGRLEEAAGGLVAALRIDPGSVRALNNLGRVALLQGRPAAAEATYLRVLGRDPANLAAHLNLVDLYLDVLGRQAEGAAHCHQAAAIDRSHPAVRACLERVGEPGTEGSG